MHPKALRTFFLAGAALATSGVAAAQDMAARAVREVRFDQKLDSQVPLDLRFKDSDGSDVRLGDIVAEKPVLLVLAYYECPMLCTQVLNGLAGALKRLDSLEIGEDFDVITISIDPGEKPELAARKKQSYVESLGKPGAERGWHFLTGDEPAIRSVADAIGFHYLYDPGIDEFAHPGGFVVLTPSGRVSRYFIDIAYSPLDMRLALVESSEGKIGNLIDAVLLLCYPHDPLTGRYGLAIKVVLRIAGGITVLLIGGYVARMLWSERARARTAGAA